MSKAGQARHQHFNTSDRAVQTIPQSICVVWQNRILNLPSRADLRVYPATNRVRG
jgi:hypothetical protein